LDISTVIILFYTEIEVEKMSTPNFDIRWCIVADREVWTRINSRIIVLSLFVTQAVFFNLSLHDFSDFYLGHPGCDFRKSKGINIKCTGNSPLDPLDFTDCFSTAQYTNHFFLGNLYEKF